MEPIHFDEDERPPTPPRPCSGRPTVGDTVTVCQGVYKGQHGKIVTDDGSRRPYLIEGMDVYFYTTDVVPGVQKVSGGLGPSTPSGPQGEPRRVRSRSPGGTACCFDFMAGRCGRGNQCRFSHFPRGGRSSGSGGPPAIQDRGRGRDRGRNRGGHNGGPLAICNGGACGGPPMHMPFAHPLAAAYPTAPHWGAATHAAAQMVAPQMAAPHWGGAAPMAAPHWGSMGAQMAGAMGGSMWPSFGAPSAMDPYGHAAAAAQHAATPQWFSSTPGSGYAAAAPQQEGYGYGEASRHGRRGRSRSRRRRGGARRHKGRKKERSPSYEYVDETSEYEYYEEENVVVSPFDHGRRR